MRAQTTLPSIAVALVLLTVPAVLGVVLADGALQANERPAVERQTALAVSDRLVGATAPITVRANVLDRSAIESLSAADLRDRYGVPEDASAAVALGGERIVETDPDTAGGQGTRIERIVRVATVTERTLAPDLSDAAAVTLPRRTANATVEIDPGPDATVETVRANDRVVLRDEDGLDGRFDVSLSRYETTTVSFDGEGDLATVSVEIAFRPRETHRSRLVVWIDA